jgi:hypothetical protein
MHECMTPHSYIFLIIFLDDYWDEECALTPQHLLGLYSHPTIKMSLMLQILNILTTIFYIIFLHYISHFFSSKSETFVLVNIYYISLP